MRVADSILKSRYALVLTIALLVEGALFYTALGLEKIPLMQPLDLFPSTLCDWQMVQESRVEAWVQEVLRADDTLSRRYARPGAPVPLDLFIAYFKTQRANQTPHSPKNCLPGSGWEQIADGYAEIAVPGEPAPIKINRYIVAKGNDQSVTLYWYQSGRRVVANEYAAKFWVVMDSIRYHRSDTSLVKITVPVAHGDTAHAAATGIGFVQVLYPVLRTFLPQ